MNSTSKSKNFKNLLNRLLNDLDNVHRLCNANAINEVSLRGAERRSNLKDKIATPFGLAMTM